MSQCKDILNHSAAKVLGHLLIRSLVRLLHTTHFARALRCAPLSRSRAHFAHSLARGAVNDQMAIYSVFFCVSVFLFLCFSLALSVAARWQRKIDNFRCDPDSKAKAEMEKEERKRCKLGQRKKRRTKGNGRAKEMLMQGGTRGDFGKKETKARKDEWGRTYVYSKWDERLYVYP